VRCSVKIYTHSANTHSYLDVADVAVQVTVLCDGILEADVGVVLRGIDALVVKQVLEVPTSPLQNVGRKRRSLNLSGCKAPNAMLGEKQIETIAAGHFSYR